MISGEAARDARKLFALQIAKQLAHRLSRENSPKLLVPLGNALANGEQLRWIRCIDASADGHRLMRDGDVVAALAVAHGAAAMERGGNVLFVRLLVLAEPNIAIDAKDGFARISFVFGGEIVQRDVQRVNQLAHRLFDFLFKDLLTRQKPFAIVVFCRPAKELQSFRWKSREGRGQGDLRFSRLESLRHRSVCRASGRRYNGLWLATTDPGNRLPATIASAAIASRIWPAIKLPRKV